MSKSQTYYEILEISENASQEVVRMAYKALAMKFHPDKFQGDTIYANNQMQKINETYEVISNSLKRSNYDEFLKKTREVYNESNQMGSNFKYDKNKEDNYPSGNEKNNKSSSYNDDFKSNQGSGEYWSKYGRSGYKYIKKNFKKMSQNARPGLE